MVGSVITDASLSKLHALFPNDFEYYMIAFEIENAIGEVTDRFIMPIMPDSIAYDQRKIVNIQKTAQGVSVLTNNSFVPKQISLEGSFGKWFKVMIGARESGGMTSEGLVIPSKPFFPNVKTGYGAMKQFERLIDKSVGRGRDGKPNTLIFYNLSFNTQYVVKVMNFNPRMGVDMNMVWKYGLNLQAVAPANTDPGKRVGRTSLLMGFSAINSRINDTGITARAVSNTITPLL